MEILKILTDGISITTGFVNKKRSSAPNPIHHSYDEDIPITFRLQSKSRLFPVIRKGETFRFLAAIPLFKFKREDADYQVISNR